MPVIVLPRSGDDMHLSVSLGNSLELFSTKVCMGRKYDFLVLWKIFYLTYSISRLQKLDLLFNYCAGFCFNILRIGEGENKRERCFRRGFGTFVSSALVVQ